MSFDIKIINGDFVLQDGDLEKVEGQNKLVQDILKICLTGIGTNIYQPWYGCPFQKSIIGSILDQNIIVEFAQSQLQNSIETLKKLQQLQLNNSFQTILPTEHIAAITEIKITRNKDPRRYDVKVHVYNRALGSTFINFPVS